MNTDKLYVVINTGTGNFIAADVYHDRNEREYVWRTRYDRKGGSRYLSGWPINEAEGFARANQGKADTVGREWVCVSACQFRKFIRMHGLKGPESP